MSNFTPGPWKAQADDFGYWGVYDNEGNCVAEAVEPGNDYLEAIQLMVAAPEMKELLEGELYREEAGVLSWEREAKIRAILERIEGEEG